MVRNNVLYTTIDVRELQFDDGSASFADWFDGLSPGAANRVMVALRRMRQGNLGNWKSDWKSVGQGVFEQRIHFEKGDRVYFGPSAARAIAS